MSHINLLEYQEIENDPTKEIVLKEEAFYGFNPTKPLNFDDRYIALHNAIASDEEFQNFQFPSLHHVHKKTLMNSASLWSELGIE